MQIGKPFGTLFLTVTGWYALTRGVWGSQGSGSMGPIGWDGAKWERLQAVIDMTDEEWLEKLDSESEEGEEGEEEGEVPAGP